MHMNSFLLDTNYTQKSRQSAENGLVGEQKMGLGECECSKSSFFYFAAMYKSGLSTCAFPNAQGNMKKEVIKIIITKDKACKSH